MKKAKVIATIGPACEDPKTIYRMIKAGLDVCRLNFSFGDHAGHKEKIRAIREAAEKAGKKVAILQDLQGPKIRVGKLKGPVTVKRNNRIILTGKTEHDEKFILPTTYQKIANDTEPGKTILIADGRIILEVLSVNKRRKQVECKVIQGGTIITGKGINLPYTKISLPALTPKDIEDAIFGAQAGVDYMGLSFVRTAKDVLKLRKLLKQHGAEKLPIIAKLEKPEALDNLDEILEVVDGVMVARGDLADEISYSTVPAAQKKIIHTANKKGKITIIATEMLSSLIDNPLPTRAEVSDVANGVLDGSDAVMLSNETATGVNPVNAVRVMARIVRDTEKLFGKEFFHQNLNLPKSHKLKEAMCESAAHLSYSLDERAIVVLTSSGETARILSKFRPQSIIYAGTCSDSICNKMAFFHNVLPIRLQKEQSVCHDDAEISLKLMKEELMKRKLVKKGDRLIVLSGISSPDHTWSLDSINVVELK